jgi:antitoxin component of MazEF toxin-antitoxin module
MRVSAKKWGNSAAVRIPAAVLDVADVTKDNIHRRSISAGRKAKRSGSGPLRGSGRG